MKDKKLTEKTQDEVFKIEKEAFDKWQDYSAASDEEQHNVSKALCFAIRKALEAGRKAEQERILETILKKADYYYGQGHIKEWDVLKELAREVSK